MKAMILAAGLGTRLRPFTDHHPKALATINGRTLLEHSIRYLQQHGIYDVVVNVHHFADQIEAVLTANKGFGSAIHISDERDAVLETGGGVKKAAPFLAGENSFAVMNVDVVTDLNLKALIAAHDSKSPLATLAVMDRVSSRQLLFDDAWELTGWNNSTTGETRNARAPETTIPRAFSGIQIISGRLLSNIQREGKFSLIDLYLEAAATGVIQGFDHSGGTFIDVGKPESLAAAEKRFAENSFPLSN